MPAPGLTAEEVREHQDRVRVFVAQGFEEREADLLASAGTEPHQAHVLLSAGCPHDLAVRILI